MKDEKNTLDDLIKQQLIDRILSRASLETSAFIKAIQDNMSNPNYSIAKRNGEIFDKIIQEQLKKDYERFIDAEAQEILGFINKLHLEDVSSKKPSQVVSKNGSSSHETVSNQKTRLEKLEAFERESSRQKYNADQLKKRSFLEQLVSLTRKQEELKKAEKIEQAKTVIDKSRINEEDEYVSKTDTVDNPIESNEELQNIPKKPIDFTESTESAIYRMYMDLYNSRREPHIIDVKIGSSDKKINTFKNNLHHAVDHGTALREAEKNLKEEKLTEFDDLQNNHP